MANNLNHQTCYRCGAIATSNEHVPPKCLFPEQKDSFGYNYRDNLLTVPSCDEHNSKKSNDDEFLMLALAFLVKSNYVGFLQMHTKAARAIRRKGEKFVQNLTGPHFTNKSILINGKKSEVILATPDMDRIMNSLESISYGLYYHRFKGQFDGDVRIVIDFVIYQDTRTIEFQNIVRTLFDQEINEMSGKNNRVFQYQFTAMDNIGCIGLKMTFYEYSHVFVSFVPKSLLESEKTFTQLSIENGWPTTIKLKNGSTYTFNKKEGTV